jgi:sulfite oxidase
VPAGSLRVRGVALTGGDRRVAGVHISGDGGDTWRPAALEGAGEPFAWQHWSAELDLPPGRHELVVRAQDSAGSTQPEHLQSVWNARGYMNNAWHRVTVIAA